MKKYLFNGFLTVISALWLVSPAVGDSLFNPDGYRAFATDHKAYRPGDSLTVLVTEIATATSSARTTTGKNTSFSASLTKRLESFDLGAAVGDDYSGGGQTERSGKLLAKITVTVQSIDERGSLSIKGEQTIDVNNERQSISLTGRVRPQDIGPDNTVDSSRVTEAHIEYVGNGAINEKQRPGVVSRILSFLGIF